MIYKIISKSQWSDFQQTGVFTGSAVDIADGYIHFSNAHQVAETAAKHFNGQTDLMLLQIDDRLLGDELKFETSRGGDQFPHLYAKLSLDQICNRWELNLDPKTQRHRFPEEVLA